jgi:hypothetical protein
MRCTCEQASREAWNEALEAAAARCDEASAWCAKYAEACPTELGRMIQANYLAEDIRAMKRTQPANVRPAGGDEAAAATRQPPSGDAAPPPGDATFGEKLIEAAKEAREIAQGKREPASVYLPPEWRSVDGGVDW